MRHALAAFLLALCFPAGSYLNVEAQESAKAPAREGGEAVEEVSSLVSLLKRERAVHVPTTNNGTQRLSSVRAEGCILRYNVATEFESPSYNTTSLPHNSYGGYSRTDREFTVNLAELDAARVSVKVRNQLKKEGGGLVIFLAAGGREAVRERWVQNSRLGVRALERWQKAGSLPLRDEASLEGAAEALKRAIGVCAAGSP